MAGPRPAILLAGPLPKNGRRRRDWRAIPSLTNIEAVSHPGAFRVLVTLNEAELKPSNAQAR
jgi:hypothetical protein